MNWRSLVFKLVAVGGKLRGTELTLNEGVNTLGRSPECDHPLELDGISKKHMQITVNGDSCFLEDLGSSNGTFVNGKLVKKLTLKDKDKVALPNVILQLVYVKEKKIVVKRQVAKEGESLDESTPREVAPNDLLGKIKFSFRTKVMQVLYSFNEQYEWNFMLGVLLVLFVLANVSMTVGPVMISAEDMVYKEIKARGAQYADEVARLNAIHLSRGDIQRIDTSFLEQLGSKGVESYELLDMDGRIVRPASKIDTYTDDVFSSTARQVFKETGRYTGTYVNTSLANDTVGIAKVLTVNNAMTQRIEPVGIIALRFKPDSVKKLSIMKSTIYLESFIYSCMLAVLFYGFIYYLTLKPIDEIRFQAEEVMRGRKKELDSQYQFIEIKPLRNSFNAVLQKNRELQSEEGGDFVDIEDDASYVATLKEIMNGTNQAALILNSEKQVEYVNEQCGDITGMIENLIQGKDIIDVAGNEGFAGTLIKLCDDSANNGGTSQTEYYELKGDEYVISVASLIGKDNFAKAFYITFYRDQ